LKITQRIEFAPKAHEKSRVFETTFSHRGGAANERGQQNLAVNLAVELEKGVVVSKYYNALPKVPRTLSRFASQPIHPERFAQDMQDIENVRAVWLEIGHTLLEAKFLLSEAHAYKDSEPPESAKDEKAQYRRHQAHFEKMYRLNLAVLDLVKVQDLIARLLFESFSGELIRVDRAKDDWERDITFTAVKNGLKERLDSGKLGRHEHDTIVRAITPVSPARHEKIAVDYRNEIAHRIRPSVDYVYLYAYLQDRNVKELRDATGKVTGWQYSVGERPTRPKYYFKELYPALVEHMKGIIGIVRRLKKIRRFR